MGPVWDFNLAFDNANYGELSHQLDCVGLIYISGASRTFTHKRYVAMAGGTHNPEGWTFDACPDCPECTGAQQGCCCRDGTWSPFPFWWAALVAQPQFFHQLRCRWDELRAAEFSDAMLDQRIDRMRDELGEAQIRNFAQWQVLNTHLWPNPVSPCTFVDSSACGATSCACSYHCHDCQLRRMPGGKRELGGGGQSHARLANPTRGLARR